MRDLLAGAVLHRLVHIIAGLLDEEAVNPHHDLVLGLLLEVRLPVHCPTEQPRRVFRGHDAAGDHLASERIAFGDLLDVARDAFVERGDGGRLPFGFGDVRAEHVRAPERRVLRGDATPQIPCRRRPLIELGWRVVVAVVRVLGQRADGHEDQVVGAKVDAALTAAFTPVLAPMDACGLLAFRCDVEVDIGDLAAVLEHHTLVQQPLHQRLHQRFVLVVLGELQRREIRHAGDLVDEAVQVELHLERRVPFLEGEHRAPVEPEVAVQELQPEDLVDALVLHLPAGGQEELDQLLLRRLAEREQAVGVRVFAAIHGGALQRGVRIVFVEPIELVEHAGAVDLQRRDRAVQVPQALEVIFHFAPAANHEAFFRLLDAVQRATRQQLLLQQGDPVARHLAVADQEGRARQ